MDPLAIHPSSLRSDVDMDDAVAIAADAAYARRASCDSNDRALRQARHPEIGRQTFPVQGPVAAGMRPVAEVITGRRPVFAAIYDRTARRRSGKQPARTLTVWTV